ncbi:MAG: hypothetical protein IPN11_07040 [Opitutaceae bacterium]|nr:hypothetical protein [Opitutaceae bacterium]
MNWNDYEAVWKRQELPLGAAADVVQIKATFETKSRKLAATLLVRDLLEAGAGLVVCIVLAFIWRKLGATGWPIGLAMALILGISAVFVRHRFRSRKIRLSEGAPLLAKVEADLTELRQQRHLLQAIWWWYLGPVFAAILIVHFTLMFHSAPWTPQRDPVFSAGFVGFYAFCIGVAWFINHRAGRKQLEPRIVELEKLRGELVGG